VKEGKNHEEKCLLDTASHVFHVEKSLEMSVVLKVPAKVNVGLDKYLGNVDP